MKRFGILFLATLSILGSAQSCLAAETFILNHDHTTIGFNVSYLLVSRVRGQFDDFKGSFIIDHEHPENNRADIIIKTASVDTGLDWRDEEIRGPNLFNADHYPIMVFHSDIIEVKPDNTGHIKGDLTLLGITKPVTLALIKGVKEDSFKVTGQIKRSDFGMGTFFKPIGNVVTLLICYNMADCGGNDEGDYERKKTRYNQ